MLRFHEGLRWLRLARRRATEFLLASTVVVAMMGCRSTTLPGEHRDLPYVVNGGERQQGDLYLPEGVGPFPVALVIHGGGWSARDRSDMAGVSRQLARHGIAAFNVNYRLAPEYLYPAQLEDVHAALRFLAENADRWHLDRSAFLTLGYSAGGHLALLAAGKRDPLGPELAGVIAGGAPVDFSIYPKSPYITELIGGTPAEYPDAWQDASPIRYVDAEFPPTFLYHGRWDRLVGYDNPQLLQEALRGYGVPITVDTRYAGHLFVGAYQAPSIKRAIPFIKRALSE